MKIELNEFAVEVHQNAVIHGWWEKEPSFGDIIALCHSELSEALEEHRDGRPMVWHACQDGECPCYCEGCGDWENGVCEIGALDEKPEGIAVELADCIIRILDYCAQAGVDMEKILMEKHRYNQRRPYRHGGKAL